MRILGKKPPLVILRLQGREVPLWLDLGAATPLILHPTLLGELKTTPTGDNFSGFGMEGRITTAPVLKLDRAELGDRVFADVSVIADTHDDAYRTEQMPPGQGAIGAGFFAGYRLVIDYRRQRLTLIAGDEPQHACRGQVLPLVQDPAINWGLVSRVRTDIGKRLFVWDTGSPALVMLKAALLGTGLEASRDTATLAHVQMNGHEFGPLTFQVWDFPAPVGMTGFIGYDFFARHVVCVDFPGHRMRVR